MRSTVVTVRRTEFIAVGCADLPTCARSLEARGWETATVREDLARNFLGERPEGSKEVGLGGATRVGGAGRAWISRGRDDGAN